MVFDVNHDIVLRDIMDQYYPSAPVAIGNLTSRKIFYQKEKR